MSRHKANHIVEFYVMTCRMSQLSQHKMTSQVSHVTKRVVTMECISMNTNLIIRFYNAVFYIFKAANVGCFEPKFLL